MGKIAFLFVGQGAQYVGMGKEIAENYKAAMNIFNNANSALDFDIKDMIFNGIEEDLKITENTQPCILTTTVAILKVLEEKGIRPDVLAGLSLGEYSAYVASGIFNFNDAVRLVRKRGKYMQEEVPVGVGTMAAIMGLEREKVIEACKFASTKGTVEPANFNCPGQIVIAGEIEAVDLAIDKCLEFGAKRGLKLSVSAPFHCSMLKGAGEKLGQELENIALGELKIPIITNVKADYVHKQDIKELLIKQVSSPVLWEDIINKMLEDGVDTFIEIGPGKVLSGFVKKINKDVKVLNVEDLASLENCINNL